MIWFALIGASIAVCIGAVVMLNRGYQGRVRKAKECAARILSERVEPISTYALIKEIEKGTGEDKMVVNYDAILELKKDGKAVAVGTEPGGRMQLWRGAA